MLFEMLTGYRPYNYETEGDRRGGGGDNGVVCWKSVMILLCLLGLCNDEKKHNAYNDGDVGPDDNTQPSIPRFLSKQMRDVDKQKHTSCHHITNEECFLGIDMKSTLYVFL
jgi:hypothetical protein